MILHHYYNIVAAKRIWHQIEFILSSQKCNKHVHGQINYLMVIIDLRILITNSFLDIQSCHCTCMCLIATSTCMSLYATIRHKYIYNEPLSF